MLGGESNKLHKPGTAIPLRDLPANLETRVKNKDRASPKMCTLKMAMIRLGLGKYFQGVKTVRRHVGQQRAIDECCLNHYWVNAQPHEPSCDKPSSILFEYCAQPLHSDAWHQHQKRFGIDPWRCSHRETRSRHKHHCRCGSS